MRSLLVISLLLSSSLSFSQEQDSCITYAPNIITPDCDGDCTCWRIYSDCELTDFDLKIYNRWGEIVFESTDPAQEWCPGFTPLTKLEDGVYIWKVSFFGKRDADGDALYELQEKRTITGHITYLY